MKKLFFNAKEFERIVTLSFDETSLHKQICFDRKEKKMDHTIVYKELMVRAINNNWK